MPLCPWLRQCNVDFCFLLIISREIWNFTVVSWFTYILFPFSAKSIHKQTSNAFIQVNCFQNLIYYGMIKTRLKLQVCANVLKYTQIPLLKSLGTLSLFKCILVKADRHSIYHSINKYGKLTLLSHYPLTHKVVM